MPTGLSVVVVADGSADLVGLVRSLDQQSVPATDFEVVIVDRGLTAESRARLAYLAARRPNVSLSGPAEDVLDRLAERVLLVGPRSRLFPEAIAYLIERAENTDLDIIAGRSVFPNHPLTSPFLTDLEVDDVSDRVRALQAPVMLVARHWVDGTTGRLADDVTGATVGTLARYPVSEETDLGGPPVPGSPVVTEVVTTWVDRVLEVSCAGTWHAVEPAAGDKMIAILRRLGSQLSFVTDAEDVVGSRTWNAAVRVDPFTAAAGTSLPPGIYEIDLILLMPGGATVPVAVPSGGPSGVIGPELSVLVSTGATSGRLQIDVGPAYFSVLQDVDPDDAEVIESASGSVLTVTLPFPALGDTCLSARLGLGSLRLPATIECHAGKATFRAHVSGLCGDAEITSQFGRSRFQPSGASLLIDGTGAMSVVRTASLETRSPALLQLTSTTGQPRPAPSPPGPTPAAPNPGVDPTQNPAPPADGDPRPEPPLAAVDPGSVHDPEPEPAPAVGSPPRSPSPVARPRRAVPGALEPIARAVSRNPWAQRIYRSLSDRTR